jgi:prophage regulatory protein
MMSAIPLEDTRLLRLPEVLALVPVGKSTWWQGVSDGRFPKPVKIGPRVSAWRAKDIRDLISRLSAEI